MTEEQSFSFYVNLNSHVYAASGYHIGLLSPKYCFYRLIDPTRNLDKNGCVLSSSSLDLGGIWAIVCFLLNFSIPLIVVLIVDHFLPHCQSAPESPGLRERTHTHIHTHIVANAPLASGVTLENLEAEHPQPHPVT